MNKFFLILALLLISPFCRAEVLQDEFVIETLKNCTPPITHQKYNYEDLTKIPIKLELVGNYGTEADLSEGDEISFKLLKSIIYNEELIAPKGCKVTAKVGLIITSGMNGIPASIVLKDFKIRNIPQTKLTETYEIFGQDRSLLVFPLKWALTPIPPTGSLTNFIKGGHAKLKNGKVITIYYHPNWI